MSDTAGNFLRYKLSCDPALKVHPWPWKVKVRFPMTNDKEQSISNAAKEHEKCGSIIVIYVGSIIPKALWRINILPILQTNIWNYLQGLLNQFRKCRTYVNIILNKWHLPKRWNAGCAIVTDKNSHLS